MGSVCSSCGDFSGLTTPGGLARAGSGNIGHPLTCDDVVQNV
jgi:hypothetical protein